MELNIQTFKLAFKDGEAFIFDAKDAGLYSELEQWDYDLAVDLNSPLGVVLDANTNEPRNRTEAEYGLIQFAKGKVELMQSMRAQIGQLVDFLTAGVTTAQLIHWQGKADRARAMHDAVTNGHAPNPADLAVVNAELATRQVEGETWQQLTQTHIEKNAQLSSIVATVEGSAKVFTDRLESLTTPTELQTLGAEVQAYAEGLKSQLAGQN